MTRMMRLSPEQYDAMVQGRQKRVQKAPESPTARSKIITVGSCPATIINHREGPPTIIPTDPHLKYKNRPVGGYQSRREARRAQELKLMDRAGKINHLKEQVPFVLIPAQFDAKGRCIERKCSYVADFTYTLPSGEVVVEDCKAPPTRTPEYRIKKKLMLQVHKIRIKET